MKQKKSFSVVKTECKVSRATFRESRDIKNFRLFPRFWAEILGWTCLSCIFLVHGQHFEWKRDILKNLIVIIFLEKKNKNLLAGAVISAFLVPGGKNRANIFFRKVCSKLPEKFAVSNSVYILWEWFSFRKKRRTENYKSSRGTISFRLGKCSNGTFKEAAEHFEKMFSYGSV